MNHQFTDSLLDRKINKNSFLLKRILKACEVINKYNSKNIKIAIFDENLNFLDGNNVDDSFKVGTLYEIERIRKFDHFLRATGPLHAPSVGTIGYYKIDLNNKFVSDSSKHLIHRFVTYCLFILTLLIVMITIILNKWILPAFESSQRNLETRFSTVSELLNSIVADLAHWSQQQRSRSGYSEELMERSDNLKLSLNSSLEIMQQKQNLLEEFENSLRSAMTSIEKLQKTQQTLKMIIASGHDSLALTTKLALKKEVFTMNAVVEVSRSARNTKGLAVLIDEIHNTDKTIIKKLEQIQEDFVDISTQLEICAQSKDLLLKNLSELTYNHKQNSKRLMQTIDLTNSHSKSNLELYSTVKMLHKIGLQDLLTLKQIDQNNDKIRELQSELVGLKQFTAEKIDSNKEDDLNE